LAITAKDGSGEKGFDQSVLQEEYLKNLDQLEEGQLIEGIVIQVGDESVFIDVGYKSEGKIPIEEFAEKPAMGDKVPVVLVTKEGRGGQVVVSKKKADVKVFWKNLRDAFDSSQPVEGIFAKSIKGGYEVNLGYGVTAFCPLSKTDVFRVNNPEEYVGAKAKFLIDRLYSDNKIKIVLSRRAWLEKETALKRDKFFETIEIGAEVTGTVKSFTSFGAFVDLGGFDGLLHINDMSWGHVTKPKDYVVKGQEIKLKVIRLDYDEKKINLSLKHFTPDPWTTFEDKYGVDDIVKGKVTKLTDFGAFIELEEGIEGLAHISELSWVKRIKHPREILNPGDEVETKILGYDLDQGRISLGLKQVFSNPWDTIDAKFPVGMHLKKEVKKLTNSGAFIEIDEGIDGFLHVEDMSWTKRIRNPSSVISEGEEVEVVIIEIDKETRRIRLGMKQLSDDPWKALAGNFPKGSVIEGVVTSITDFGLFVRVKGEIEGLVNKSHIAEPGSEEDEETAMKKYNEGDSVKTLVMDINPEKQRLSLSIREFVRNQQRAELSRYIHDDSEEGTVTLGDMLKEKGNGSFES
jgi:small subunit ribosomal protein S1